MRRPHPLPHLVEHPDDFEMMLLGLRAAVEAVLRWNDEHGVEYADAWSVKNALATVQVRATVYSYSIEEVLPDYAFMYQQISLLAPDALMWGHRPDGRVGFYFATRH